jgi:hypothetical protein
MAEIEFKRGEYIQFRVTTDVHLLERVLRTDEVVEFDGVELIWAGEKHNLPSLKGAINSEGWLVPVEDTNSTYTPTPADIRVGPAENVGSDRKRRMRIETVVEEEQLVGTVAGTKAKREASDEHARERAEEKAQQHPAGERVAPEAPPTRKKFKVEAHESQDAVPIATLSSPAKQSLSLKDGGLAAEREIRRLTNVRGSDPVKVQKVAAARKKIATGDVEEAKVGTELEELLPDASSSKKPKPKPTGRSKPDFAWDQTRQWKVRLKEALQLASTDPAKFRHVLSVETTKMKHHIRKGLTRPDGSPD